MKNLKLDDCEFVVRYKSCALIEHPTIKSDGSTEYIWMWGTHDNEHVYNLKPLEGIDYEKRVHRDLVFDLFLDLVDGL